MTVLRDYASALSQPALPAGTGDAAEVARYDEVVGPDGALRPAWKALAEVAVSITPADLRRVDGDITAFLADDGVTYARPGEGPGPWQLDPVPLIIDAASWAPLEVGLAQRAELLNAILADLYADQRLLRDGLLPPAVVLGHGGFTRVVARASSRDPRPLVFSATDLGRDADGRWRVLADRAQAPSGHRLRDGEPAGGLAGHAGALPRGRAAPDGALLLGAPVRAAPVRAGRPGRPAGGRAVAGDALGDGVRPGVRRQRPGLPAGPGQRPGRPRRLGLDAVAVGRAGAGGRDPAPGRRGVERPARAARGVPARRGGPDRGRTPRPGAHRQRARCGRRREPRPAALPAGGLRGAARRAAAPGVGADLVVRRPALARAGPRPARRPPGADHRRTGRRLPAGPRAAEPA